LELNTVYLNTEDEFLIRHSPNLINDLEDEAAAIIQIAAILVRPLVRR
jgi:hypothetical protein